MENKKHTNKLIHASSPYLQQHAHNPVNWYEWGEEAFEIAHRENKLILVSIGYSACHWCHVMERECFEQEDTAEIMNKHFVCIKVDREERPDVDQIYMDAVQLLTGRGGWPLNCFTLPDGRPIHGGTYFPKQEWERILKSLADFYENKTEEAMQYATELTNGIRKLNILVAESESILISKDEINEIINNWKQNFDAYYGGYSWAPKFPMPNNWELFLHLYHYTKDVSLLEAVVTTLNKMAEGGIYDQVGGGFARYSTDSYWKVPHFEKMLYDNAQLVSLYAQAYQITDKQLYANTINNTLSFITRELMHECGYFYSALDADSEGIEGKFYTWTYKEILDVLGDDAPLYSLYYNIDAYGNWEDGVNILYKTRSDEEIEKLTGKSITYIEQLVKRCNDKLLAVRANRIRPGLDDKMITSWNVLTIKAFADAYLVLGNESYLTVAKTAANFIMNTMWQNEKLFRIHKNGVTSISGFAEDYATTCEGFIRLYEACSDESYLLFAKKILDAAITKFFDLESGLFYFKAHEDEQLVARKIDTNDDVISSSNSVLAKCLIQMGYLFDEHKYHQIYDRMLLQIQPKLKKHPMGYSNWFQVILFKWYGFNQLVCVGKNAHIFRVDIHKQFLPNKLALVVNQKSSIPLLIDKEPSEETMFYRCIDKSCSLPETNIINFWNKINNA
jgi:uncharacterized protein YyaL (SSP411 family)